MQERGGASGNGPSGEDPYSWDQPVQRPQPFEVPSGFFRNPAPQPDPRDSYERPHYDNYADYDDDFVSKGTQRKSRKGLIASVVVLALVAGGGVAVAESGVLKHKKDSSSTQAQTGGTTDKAPSTGAMTPAPPMFSDQVPTISDGTNVVQINHRAVTFPSTVTDAVWSPNGTRLAYIDGDGNVAVADASGGNVQVLTKTDAAAKRSDISWNAGTSVNYTFTSSTGQRLFDSAYLNPADAAAPGQVPPATMAPDPKDTADNSDYTTAQRMNPLGSGGQVVAAWLWGSKVMEDEYIQKYMDPDSNGYGGYGWFSIATGGKPTINPDGYVAYVGSNGQIFVAGRSDDALNQKPVQITFGAAHPSHPAWSPDGKRVAFETTTDVESVAVDLKSKAVTNPAKQEYAKPGIPTYQNTGGSLATLAFSSSDPTSVSIAVSQGKWLNYADAQKNDSGIASPKGAVIVTAGSSTALASSAALASELGYALYVTPRGKLDARITAELTRLFGHHGGGRTFSTTIVATAAEIPASADAAIAKITGASPTRVSSSDIDIAMNQFSAAILSQPSGTPITSTTFVTAQDDKAGLLTALGAAGLFSSREGSRGPMIVLTKGSTLPDSAKAVLGRFGTGDTVYVFGDEAAAAITSWSPKPPFTVTKFIGATPQALSVGTLKDLPGDLRKDGKLEMAGSQMAALDVLPVGGDQTAETILAASAQEPVLFADPSSGLDADSLAFAKTLAAQLLHVDTIGDAAGLEQQLTTALGSPGPANVITNPKASK